MNLLFLGASNTDCRHCFTSDNLGTGYVKMFSDSFRPVCESRDISLSVTNGGSDGFTFPRIYHKWKQFYSSNPYDAVILLGGINETGLIHNTMLAPQEAELYIRNSCLALHKLLTELYEKNVKQIILLEPFLFEWPDYLSRRIPTLNRIRSMIQSCIQSVSSQNEISIHYLHTQKPLDALCLNYGSDYVTSDGIHLTESGHSCISSLLLQVFQSLLANGDLS